MLTPADPRDVESIDAIIAAAYDVISGPAGQKRDWNRERSLFYPGARIMPTASVPGRNDVDLEPQMLDVEKYIARAEPLLSARFLRNRNCAAHRTVWPDRSRLEHVRIASRSKRSRAIHARHQQLSAFQRRQALVDLVGLLAARKCRARDSRKISLTPNLTGGRNLLSVAGKRYKVCYRAAF